MKILGHLAWDAVAVAAAFCLGGIALHRGEHINSIWLVLAASCTYVLGFRFYARFIAARVAMKRRPLPGRSDVRPRDSEGH